MVEENSDRKIAVIFATDVVGYSKAIENNETQTLKNLKECRNILDNLILKHKGRIFNTAGDSVLAEFSSAVSAIECATLFQTKIRDRNASAKDSEIIFTTNCLFFWILIRVSFLLPSQPLLAGANIIVGGLEQTPLK